MTASRKLFAAVAALACLAMTPAWSQDNKTTSTDSSDAREGGLTTKATNPIGSLIQLQLQNLFIPSSDNSSGWANTFLGITITRAFATHVLRGITRSQPNASAPSAQAKALSVDPRWCGRHPTSLLTEQFAYKLTSGSR